MILMSTYSVLDEVSGSVAKSSWKDDDGTCNTTQFNYIEPYHNHYQYRHKIDDHNNMIQGNMSIEDSFGTKIWATRVVTYILDTTEVNNNNNILV